MQHLGNDCMWNQASILSDNGSWMEVGRMATVARLSLTCSGRMFWLCGIRDDCASAALSWYLCRVMLLVFDAGALQVADVRMLRRLQLRK